MLSTFAKKPIKKNQTTSAETKNGVASLPEIYQNEDAQQLEKPRTPYGLSIVVCVLAILGSLAAVLVYDGFFRQPLVDNNGGQKIIVDKQENITVTFEERLQKLSQEAGPVVVNFYKKPSEAGSYFFEAGQSLGGGIILTNDGWIVTAKDLAEKIGQGKYLVLTNGLKIFEPQKIVLDQGSNLAFVKIDGQDLPVARLGDYKSLTPGQELYGVIGDYPKPRMASLHQAEIRAGGERGIIESTEEMTLAVFCQEGYDVSLWGAPVINLAGEVVAIVNSEQEAVPTSYLKPILEGLLKKGEITRPELGINYINLANHPKLGVATKEMLGRGALVSGYKNMTAVAKGSPAEKVGLKSGDIIISVEDKRLGEEQSLAEIIQGYQVGQKIKMTIMREGQEKMIEATLGKGE